MKLSAQMKPKTTLRKVLLNYTHARPNADSDVIKILKNDEVGNDISLKADKIDACIVKKQKGVSLDDPAFKRNENLVTHDDSTAYETKFGNGKVFGNEKLEADGPEAEIKDNYNNKAPENIKTQASDSNLENTVAET